MSGGRGCLAIMSSKARMGNDRGQSCDGPAETLPQAWSAVSIEIFQKRTHPPVQARSRELPANHRPRHVLRTDRNPRKSSHPPESAVQHPVQARSRELPANHRPRHVFRTVRIAKSSHPSESAVQDRSVGTSAIPNAREPSRHFLIPVVPAELATTRSPGVGDEAAAAGCLSHLRDFGAAPGFVNDGVQEVRGKSGAEGKGSLLENFDTHRGPCLRQRLGGFRGETGMDGRSGVFRLDRYDGLDGRTNEEGPRMAAPLRFLYGPARPDLRVTARGCRRTSSSRRGCRRRRRWPR
jgi:hypothetical protein